MKQVSRSALVSFSAQQMFDLVNDVASYPEFLPRDVLGLRSSSRVYLQW